MKGIVLAGGNGTRLRPMTTVVSKQLLPIYDKPMIYYSLSTLFLARIKDILIIVKPQDKKLYKELLGDGSKFGVKISYAIQANANGIAEAFIIGKKFIGRDSVALVLGDNIFYGNDFSDYLRRAQYQVTNFNKATIFGYRVKNPKDFGVIDFNKISGEISSLEEKPTTPKSDWAIPGLYMYPNNVVQMITNLSPSKRGELEITDLNKLYLRKGKLIACKFRRGIVWFDTGTPKGLLNASNLVQTVQDRQGLYIACLEEIALANGWIKKSDIQYDNTEYGQYLKSVIEDENE